MFLGELEQPVNSLPGIGPASVRDLSSMDIRTIADLLCHFPRDYENRMEQKPLYSQLLAPEETRTVNTVIKVIDQEFIGWGRKQTLKVRVSDESGEAFLVCFGRNFLADTLKPGRVFYLYGKFNYRYNQLQSSTFEFEPWSEVPKKFGKILPVYPLAGKLAQATLRKAIHGAFQQYGKYLEDEVPPFLAEKYALMPKHKAIREVHFPENEKSREEALRTLKYEELFYLQIAIGRRTRKRQEQTRITRTFADSMRSQVIQRLPFDLTPDQKTVLQEIQQDISGVHPMMRLLQGDVGSGKTLVAFLSSLLCIEAGLQVAFMAPTELLAKQHAGNASLYLEPVGVRVGFLSSSIHREGRKNLIKALASGEVHLLIGTHALFSGDVRFNNLGMIVVDEQQRFGVLQRLAVMGKGKVPDLLMMTATPIPRTMALTVFGDIDISTIHTLPPGRKPVITHLAREGNEEKVYVRVREELKKGNQAYFVYPLIRQSEKLDLKDTETMFQRISRELFPDFPAGLIHSRVSEEEKEQTMEAFTRGKIKILVATSVVEVGVDVPAATCMVIEHAERFGLSALHQLRGRVGRGEKQSYAFLIFSENLTDDARLRLKIMKENSDGFRISEEDLNLRGPGDIAGVRQSGYFRLKIADIIRDFELLKTAKKDAGQILDTDPGLLSEEHTAIREVLLRSPSFPDELFDGG